MTEKLNLRQKLSKIYSIISHVDKAGRNKNQNYNFVRATDVLHAIRKALAESGVYAQTNYTLLNTYDIKTNSGGVMHTASVRVEVLFMDTESDETIAVSGLGDGADSGDKGIYKAMTGATKNALRSAFLIPDEADPEADEQVDSETQTNHKIAAQQTPRANPVSTPEKAVPPPNPNETSSNTQQPTRPAESAATSIQIPKGGVLPTGEQLDEYRKGIIKLQDELSGAGLKASANLPINRKVLMYLLKTMGTENATEITVSQWNTFFEFVDKSRQQENGIKTLVKLINDAGKAR